MAEQKIVSNAQRKRKKSKLLIIAIVAAVVVVTSPFTLPLIFKTFIFQPFRLEMSAMVPTIKPGDRVLVNKFTYRFSRPKTGDIVAFYSPEDKGRVLIKRIIALEGDLVEIKEGSLYINNRKIAENYVKFKDYSSFEPLTIPKDGVFVMGDNRPNSKDSRYYGPIKRSDILGPVSLNY